MKKQKERIQEKVIKKLEKKNTNNIWPCLFCEKKFKGSNFVLKHLEMKHENEYEKEFTRVFFSNKIKIIFKAKEEIWLENY